MASNSRREYTREQIEEMETDESEFDDSDDSDFVPSDLSSDSDSSDDESPRRQKRPTTPIPLTPAERDEIRQIVEHHPNSMWSRDQFCYVLPKGSRGDGAVQMWASREVIEQRHPSPTNRHQLFKAWYRPRKAEIKRIMTGQQD